MGCLICCFIDEYMGMSNLILSQKIVFALVPHYIVSYHVIPSDATAISLLYLELWL